MGTFFASLIIRANETVAWRSFRAKPDGKNEKELFVRPPVVHNIRGVSSNLVILEEVAFIDKEVFECIINSLQRNPNVHVHVEE